MDEEGRIWCLAVDCFESLAFGMFWEPPSGALACAWKRCRTSRSLNDWAMRAETDTNSNFGVGGIVFFLWKNVTVSKIFF